jgi:hypothetical protein
LTSSIQYGATRAFNYAEDKFNGTDRPLDFAPVGATAPQWREVVQLAAAGNHMAQKIYKLGTAMNARTLAAREGVAVPTWAQEILAPIEDDDVNDVAEALAQLNAAI